MADTTGEFGFIRWVVARSGVHPRVPLGPGDDTAGVLLRGDRQTLLTTDMLLEGSCFILAEAGAVRVGRKAMNVNLSDIAAMGGTPVCALVSVALPRDGGSTLARDLYLGLREAADRFGTAIAGGDTNTWDGRLSISVTLVGESSDLGPVRRDGAKAGDWVFATGAFGGSILAHHLNFTPRLAEAAELVRDFHPRSMIDVSDGLSADLWHICEASGLGATLDADAIPISDDARTLAARTGRSPLDHALSDGEDFELVFTLSPEEGQLLQDRGRLAGTEVTKIGETIASREYRLRRADGSTEVLEPRGYVHSMS